MTAPFYIVARRRHERAKRADFAQVRPKSAPKARPADSYGIELVHCPAGNGRVPRATCERRWRLGNGPLSRKLQPGSVEADIRASQCRGCPVGAERCGTVVPPKRSADDLPNCSGPCRQPFEPSRKGQTWCDECRERKQSGRRVLSHDGPR